jgi:hypothetical protein
MHIKIQIEQVKGTNNFILTFETWWAMEFYSSTKKPQLQSVGPFSLIEEHDCKVDHGCTYKNEEEWNYWVSVDQLISFLIEKNDDESMKVILSLSLEFPDEIKVDIIPSQFKENLIPENIIKRLILQPPTRQRLVEILSRIRNLGEKMSFKKEELQPWYPFCFSSEEKILDGMLEFDVEAGYEVAKETKDWNLFFGKSLYLSNFSLQDLIKKDDVFPNLISFFLDGNEVPVGGFPFLYEFALEKRFELELGRLITLEMNLYKERIYSKDIVHPLFLKVLLTRGNKTKEEFEDMVKLIYKNRMSLDVDGFCEKILSENETFKSTSVYIHKFQLFSQACDSEILRVKSRKVDVDFDDTNKRIIFSGKKYYVKALCNKLQIEEWVENILSSFSSIVFMPENYTLMKGLIIYQSWK